LTVRRRTFAGFRRAVARVLRLTRRALAGLADRAVRFFAVDRRVFFDFFAMLPPVRVV
jgi:hypothetical protein